MGDEPDASTIPLPQTPPASPRAIDKIIINAEVPEHVEAIIETVTPRASTPRVPTPKPVAPTSQPGELDQLQDSFKIDRITRNKDEATGQEYVIFAQGEHRLHVVYFNSDGHFLFCIEGNILNLSSMYGCYILNSGVNQSKLGFHASELVIPFSVPHTLLAHFLLDAREKLSESSKRDLPLNLCTGCPKIPRRIVIEPPKPSFWSRLFCRS